MPRQTDDSDDNGGPAGAAGAEVDRSSAAETSPPPASASSASAAAAGANTSPDTSATAAAAGVENHPAPDDAPVPVGMIDTSCNRAEKGRVELVDGDDEGPVPPAQLFDDGSSSKIEGKKAASRQIQARAAAIIEAKSAASHDVQPQVATGRSGMRDDIDDAQPTPVTPTVRPPPPSMLPHNSSASESAEPSVPILQARLVEDESERPVYDAIPLEPEHWAKRHQRKIVGGFVLVIVALVVTLAVLFGKGDAPQVYGSQCFVNREELQVAVNRYTAGGAACWRGEGECEVIQTYGWPIGTWCTSNVTDMSYLFQWKDGFIDDLSSWDTSKVTSMAHMFDGASSFDGDVSSFDTSKVTDMQWMFNGASIFNGDVSSFDTSKVTSMQDMFYFAREFNGDVSKFDTSKVTSMPWMFALNYAFNQDVSRWDVASVTDMREMFYWASSFDQNLCAWGDHYNATVRDYDPDDDSTPSGPYRDMFLNTNCPNQNDPAGPDANWCAATCNSTAA